MKISSLFPLLCAPVLFLAVACEKKGPAEEVGEKLDEAVKAVEDAVDPKGPAEKVGEALDDAGRKISDAVDNAVNN